MRQHVGMERAQEPLADEAVDGTGRNRLLEGELHAVCPERRGREAERVGGLHLLVEEHARLRRLVVRFVEHHEVRRRRRLLEERHRADRVAVEFHVRHHHLLEEVAARRDPVDLESPPEQLLEQMDRLKRHVGLARAHGRLQHDGRLALLHEAGQTGGHGLLLVGSRLPGHPRTFSPRSSPRK